MDDLLIARIQMALSLGFHIVFAAIGIGAPLFLAIAEWRWVRTRSAHARALARLWAKGTAIFFAVGAVSGTVLSFELGLLWPGFMEHAGGIIGAPFGLEGFAFFLEAIFLGIYLYGWDRVPPWAHLGAACVVAVCGAGSAVFIIMVNGWMNAPAGFDFDPATGVFSNIDPVAAMFNQAWGPQVVHMLIAAYTATAFAAAALHAVRLLRHPDSRLHRLGLTITMTVGVVGAFAQPFAGDWAAKVVAERQPAKFAAMEGHFRTETHAPLRIGGIPDEETMETPWAIEVPGVLSFLAFGDFGAEVRGLEEFPRDEWPPVLITHLSFQVMVGLGVLMMAVGGWWLIGAIRHGRLTGRGASAPPPGRWLLRAIVLCAPAGFIAIEAGWMVTEVGRQPWIIQGVMRTSEAVTGVEGLGPRFLAFMLVYVVLTVIVTRLMWRQVLGSPLAVEERESQAAPDRKAARDGR